MSKAGHRGSTGKDVPEYPAIEARIGENPARFLVDPDETTYAVIRGIEDVKRLDCWFAIEEDLGPRKEVLAALNERREALSAGETDE